MMKRAIMRYTLTNQSQELKQQTLPDGMHFEELVATDTQLAELLYRSFHDTVDDEGESMAEWLDEVQATFAGKYGEIITPLTFKLCHEDKAIGAFITSNFREIPLILYVVIHPDYRGQQLSKALLRQGIAIAEKEGLESLYLTVTLKNVAAYQLYQKVGFEVIGENWDEVLA